ncbi:MAG: maltose alpha-D-glucosyltransferase [Gemmatimonadetes bacterium]|nr:maltose alpha-D-glucosyltransferase [Gemmatimonadota bacterium]
MARRSSTQGVPENDPLWYGEAVIYQLHVRAFCDTDGDGIGDFQGLTRKLDYLQDLGVTALWLLPFYPSPLRDDGYDIADWNSVHPSYGTLRDFKLFLREAHRRGLRVITELVLNHTSDQHPWFQRARRARPGSKYRDYYVWSEAPDRYADARIIFKDYEISNWAWDPVAKAYYWHRFYSHQPDLNYDNPEVQAAMFEVMDYWLRMGVDGMRLDAVPYLYEREGTNCENLAETHAFLKRLRCHVDERFRNRMLLAEANQWPEDAVAYFGGGDECQMAFHFPVMPRLFMAIRMEDRFPIIDIMDQTPPIPESCQWALFLRNHDELTLEMVTDEERDYMYRVYAQDTHARINLGIRRRLAPLLQNNRRRIELMNGLLFSLPGTPIIYYGDEIGMGDNIYLGDRNAVRTPMQWSADRNAGFSPANPQRLYLPVIIDPEYHYEAINVQNQQANPSSLLWWMKRLIALRQRYRAFGRGSIEFPLPDNHKVLVFLRRYQEERILAVANLSRFAQCVELDLSEFRGLVPVELFGGTPFPLIGEHPYSITVGPHAFYWFTLEAPQVALGAPALAGRQPGEHALVVDEDWREIFDPVALERLEEVLPAYVRQQRWFGAKARNMRWARITEVVPMGARAREVHLVFVRLEYADADAETYLVPIAFAGGGEAEWLRRERPDALIAELSVGRAGERGALYDAFVNPAFCRALLAAIAGRREVRAGSGKLVAYPTRALADIPEPDDPALAPTPLPAEQSNTSATFGDKLILKLFRKVEGGANPEVEIGRFLMERGFAHVAPVAGVIEYWPGKNEPLTLAVLQRYVPNQGDAWRYTLDALDAYFDLALATNGTEFALTAPAAPLLEGAGAEAPARVRELIGPYLDSAWLLGQRTAELHRVLASQREDPAFAPEPFSGLYRRSLYQSMRTLTGQVLRLLAREAGRLPEPLATEAGRVLALRSAVYQRFRALVDQKITAMRIRVHGDYHLGQVLFTGRDFVIIDLEGEPARPLGERRIKRSPLRDVAGMIRSFDYACHAALLERERRGVVRATDVEAAERWAHLWYRWIAGQFLRAYLENARDAGFLPRERGELAVLLDAYILEKALYELGYELNHRPDWVRIPVHGILRIFGA